jgi:hypothetical protein
LKAAGSKKGLMIHSAKRYFSLPQTIQRVICVHQASHSVDIDGFFDGNKAVNSVRLTTQLHVLPTLKKMLEV